jgi:hypothetical protein
VRTLAAQHGARLCENVLDDPLTGFNYWLEWQYSPFRYKKAQKTSADMGKSHLRFDFSHSLALDLTPHCGPTIVTILKAGVARLRS